MTLPARSATVLALAALAAGCGRRAAPAANTQLAPPTARAAAAPAPRAASAGRETGGWIGVVLAREAVQVAGSFAGRLETVDVRVGDVVRRGDRIARIATDSQRQELAMAEANLQVGEAEVARTQAELAAAEERLARRLQAPELFSKEEIATTRLLRATSSTNLRTAEAHVREQRAHVQQLQGVLSQAEVRAPFDGRVALRYADPGTVVGADTPIVKLISRGELLVRFAAPPDQAARLSPGQPVAVRIDELGLRQRGTIEHVSPEVDGASQMIVVEARLDPDPALTSHLETGLVASVSPVDLPAPSGREAT